MYCPNCKQEYDGKFCPECGTKLIEKPATSGVSLNLGDAAAISGGLHVSDSHAVHNEDKSIHNITNTTSTVNNITQVSAQKTELELLKERETLYLNACKRAYEDNVLEQREKMELDRYRMEIGLDEDTADRILDQVRRLVNRNAPKTELTGLAKIKLKQLTDALKKNEVQAIMRQIDSFEALAGKFSNDELQYKYYLVLATLRYEKCIEKYENSKVDSYWKSFWTYFAYLKAGKMAKAAEILYSLDDKFPNYPEDNINLLATAGSYIKDDMEAAKEYLETVMGDYSPALQRFAEAVYFLLAPEIAREMGATEQMCAFYLVNIFKQGTKTNNLVSEQTAPEESENIQVTEKEQAKQGATSENTTKSAIPISHSNDILKKKWQAMTLEAYKMLLECDGPDDYYSMLNMLIPPAIAEESIAIALTACVFNSLGQGDEAEKWADKLMVLDQQNEDADVMRAKAEIYEAGIGRYEKNIDYAIAFYKAAATKGNLDALCCIANLYYMGEKVEQDYQLALSWAKIAYEAKNPFGLFIYGRAYYEGHGMPKDALTGKRLISEAAKKEDVYSTGAAEAQMFIRDNFN